MNKARYVEYVRPLHASGLSVEAIAARLRLNRAGVERAICAIEGREFVEPVMNDDPTIERQSNTAQLCEKAIRLWKQGKDTMDIAEACGTPEHIVCRVLRAWREMGRGQDRLIAFAKLGKIGRPE